jgi:hypothetical protein
MLRQFRPNGYDLSQVRGQVLGVNLALFSGSICKLVCKRENESALSSDFIGTYHFRAADYQSDARFLCSQWHKAIMWRKQQWTRPPKDKDMELCKMASPYAAKVQISYEELNRFVSHIDWQFCDTGNS